MGALLYINIFFLSCFLISKVQKRTVMYYTGGEVTLSGEPGCVPIPNKERCDTVLGKPRLPSFQQLKS